MRRQATDWEKIFEKKIDKGLLIKYIENPSNTTVCKLVQPLWRTVWRFLKKIANRTAL